MVQFKHTSEASKKGPVMIFTGEMCEYGDVFSVEGEFLIAKARANDNCEEISDLSEKLEDEQDDVDEAEQEIRAKAKDLGISHYWTKAPERLLEEIAELEKD